jgi:hypothetical protein
MKRKSIQKKFRGQKFNTHQYWNLHYTERQFDDTERDYVTFIKAKSYNLAKSILIQKIGEDNPDIKVKAIQGAMFHKTYRCDNGPLTPERWAQIREASFPNIANILYKKHLERAEGKWNRFSYPRNLSHIGFKKGDENWSRIHRKGKTLAPELRGGKIWRGDKWVNWDKDDMLKTKNLIINALILSDGHRSNAAKHLGLDRNSLHRIMSRISDIDWNKEYPPPKPFANAKPVCRKLRSKIQKKVMAERMANGERPFSKLTDDQRALRRKNAIKAKDKQRENSIRKNIPIIRDALEKNNNIRAKAADYLNVKSSWLYKWMIRTKHIINWSKEYPSPYSQVK